MGRLRPRLGLRLLAAVIAVCALAALASPRLDPASASVVAGGLSGSTTTPGDVYAQDVCPPAPHGYAQCAAQVLALRANGALVHPHVPLVPIVTSSRAPRRAARAGRSLWPVTASAQAQPQPFTAAYLQQAYDLTYLSAVRGQADTVAVIDAYDDPAAASDLAKFRAGAGLPACTIANGCFAKLDQQGTTAPLPARNAGWNVEEATDLDAVSAICPNCHLLLVEANSTALSDLVAAADAAARLGATQISNSWMSIVTRPLEDQFVFPGVSVVAATGDAGFLGASGDAYPAAFAGVIAAGATSLTAVSGAPNPRGFTETAWADSGSGCDTAIAKPAYQAGVDCAGRAYADVSADGDPHTGLAVYATAAGGWILAGGTSLASPLIAGFEAVTGVDGTTPAWAYADAASLNDPVRGSNGTCAGVSSAICLARVGYDGPTGAGSISGQVATGAPGIGGPDVSPARTSGGGGGGTGGLGGGGADTGGADTYAQSVGARTATLLGGVYPNGMETTVWWQFGTSTAYGHHTAPLDIGAGTAPVPVRTTLTGLAPSTTEHYRLVARNPFGTIYGYDDTLSTAAVVARSRDVTRKRPRALSSKSPRALSS